MNSLGFCRAAISSAALPHLRRHGRFWSYTRADDGATEPTAHARFGNIPPSRLRAVTDLRLGGSNE